MLNVGTNLFGSPLENAAAGMLPQAGAANAATQGPGLAGDNIANPYAPFGGNTIPVDPGGFGGPFGSSSFMGQFMSMIESAFAQLAQMFSQAFGSPQAGSPQPFNPQPVPQQGDPGPGGPQRSPGQNGWMQRYPETYFTDASASSLGDPHDAFDGSLRSGQEMSGKWNSMTSHPNLLLSDSFDGGFKIATNAGLPNDHGVTQNDSATVTSNSGRNVVRMNQDGSYSVSEDGRNISLDQGKPVSLGNGETVTLNADHSLTVSQTNASGGSITTHLCANGKGGVNVDATAHDVRLGGYLVNQSDKTHGDPKIGTGPIPGPNAPITARPEPVPDASAPPPISGSPIPWPSTAAPLNWTQPAASNEVPPVQPGNPGQDFFDPYQVAAVGE